MQWVPKLACSQCGSPIQRKNRQGFPHLYTWKTRQPLSPLPLLKEAEKASTPGLDFSRLHLADIIVIIIHIYSSSMVDRWLVDVDILHFNMLKDGIPGFQWTFLVFIDVTQYQQFFIKWDDFFIEWLITKINYKNRKLQTLTWVVLFLTSPLMITSDWQ